MRQHGNERGNAEILTNNVDLLLVSANKIKLESFIIVALKYAGKIVVLTQINEQKIKLEMECLGKKIFIVVSSLKCISNVHNCQ
jgi:hypothetical protein